ncbi:Phosphoribosylaminoimidazole carboxylase, chloroplastic isoform J [Glycine soja]|uniref:Phosphoribosylaminoimidazole carboxylase, chloroplastic isoform J n=1 Tax=Glycine soja TaxID=3848 RepID=A0A445F909_GLYSO|nr:Phosphoribosylaminoimidazole carboxylase, chloroplastic isoform J [Glycine soja]
MGNARKGTRARVQSGSKGFCELKEKEEKFEKRLRKIGGEKPLTKTVSSSSFSRSLCIRETLIAADRSPCRSSSILLVPSKKSWVGLELIALIYSLYKMEVCKVLASLFLDSPNAVHEITIVSNRCPPPPPSHLLCIYILTAIA